MLIGSLYERQNPLAMYAQTPLDILASSERKVTETRSSGDTVNISAAALAMFKTSQQQNALLTEGSATQDEAGEQPAARQNPDGRAAVLPAQDLAQEEEQDDAQDVAQDIALENVGAPTMAASQSASQSDSQVDSQIAALETQLVNLVSQLSGANMASVQSKIDALQAQIASLKAQKL